MLVSFLLAVALAGVDATPSAPLPDRLLVDRAEDGTVWARGVDYKLRLDGDGAAFFVRDCDRAARRFELAPVEITAGGVPLFVDRYARPTLSATTATYERGGLAEVWLLEPRGARQNFVIAALPAPGDVVLRMDLGGDLAHDETTPGATFRADGGAAVRYGDALSVDSAGRRHASAARVVDGAVEIVVPWEFLRAATLPLFVDPLIDSVGIDAGTDQPSNVDVAVDDSANAVLYVFEDTFASGDTDIVARRFNESGSFLDEVAVDVSNDETIDPAVASHHAANQFLVVWTRLQTGLFTPQKIRGRTRTANGTSQGSVFNLSAGQGNEAHPDVGGPSSASASAKYYVVWEERGTFSGTNVVGRSVTTAAGLGSVFAVDDGSGDQTFPAISATSGPFGRWLVAYQSATGSTSTKVMAGVIAESGTPIVGFLDLAVDDPGNDSQPDVAGDGSEFLVVFQRKQSNGTSDIVGARVAVGFAVLFHMVRLSEDEPGVILSRQQVSPRVVRTTNGFVYAYQEAANLTTSAFDVYAASGDEGFVALGYGEGHVLLSPGSPGFDGVPALCVLPMGETVFAAWTSVDAGNFDLEGATYYVP